MTQETNEELERFRKQWREEVIARSKGGPSEQQSAYKQHAEKLSSALGEPATRHPPVPLGPSTRAGPADKADQEEHDEDEGSETTRYRESGEKDEARCLETSPREPQSALEHYEKAVDRENEGNLGDSLTYYRKAYRLDAKVDQSYKNKHFPTSSFPKPTNPNPSNASPTVPNPAHHSLRGTPASNISQLIQSFAELAINPAPPLIEGSPPPPCPIASIPSEVLIEILLRTAITDITAYARLSLVCKRLAYLTMTEDRIWKRVCCGPEFGFAAMHYRYACSIDGTPLLSPTTLSPNTLSLTPTYPTYAHMLHHRPRLRFSGLYISTVNYVRPGASSPTQVSWNTPVHIVTYYRYLRFHRSGACLSLLTTAEPRDVVPHFSPDNAHPNHGALPSSVMKNALRGRWRLSGGGGGAKRDPEPRDGEAPPNGNQAQEQKEEEEGTLLIETESPDVASKYTYHLRLGLQAASSKAGAAKNTKLVWKGFWSYNRLTDDWAEFGLRNDRPFFWSRVRSWGVGL